MAPRDDLPPQTPGEVTREAQRWSAEVESRRASQDELADVRARVKDIEELLSRGVTGNPSRKLNDIEDAYLERQRWISEGMLSERTQKTTIYMIVVSSVSALAGALFAWILSFWHK